MENEKQTDLIGRNKLIAEYDRVHIGPPGGARKLMVDAPTVDAVEVVHSSWGEGRFNTKGEYEEQCLNCKMFSSAYGCDYCPNCGAKMDGGNEGG